MVWRIRKRQSTFWDFESPETLRRIHFIGKLEFHFVSNYADNIEVYDEHPVLIDYQCSWTDLYFSSRPQRPDELSATLQETVRRQLGGWRSPAEYFNRDIETWDLLDRGHGLLFSGPDSLIDAVKEELSAAGVKFTALPRKRTQHVVKALVAGVNFVVAREFRE